MTDTLIKLFGSAARVKLLRLFLFNPQHLISIEEAAIRAQVKPRDARQEISLFLRLGLLERHPRRGMMILCSDLLVDTEGMMRGLRLLRQRKHDVLLLHVLERLRVREM